MTEPADIVGVVIPMYNSEKTIEATLKSVTRQTYRFLDIVVVDDGSKDGSAAIVQRWAQSDNRIRLLCQGNLGVATARNNGVAATQAQYLAFVDADDLWAPDKLAEQMKVLTREGDRVGVTYSWYAEINSQGRVIGLQYPRCEGQVLARLARHFFVGHGSSLLLHRSVFDAVGGFDASLHARGAQGCEDMLFCLSVAETFEFRVVPRHLVGYRETDTNMSSNFHRMINSAEIVLDRLISKHPELARKATANLDMTFVWFVRRGLLAGRLLTATALYLRLCRRNARCAIHALPELGLAVGRSGLVEARRRSDTGRGGADRRLSYEDVIW